MRKLFLEVLFLILSLSVQAQRVSNIRAEQRGQDIVVFYSLDTNLPCEVSLLLSQDNGVTWGSPLKNVSGDVGKNISAGEKQITWKVLEEKENLVGDKMKFKVTANSRKSFEPEMVFVEGGTFQMGSSTGESDEKPVHSVTLSAFNIGKYEVTQAQWKAVMGNNPSEFSGCDDCPVENVSWNDVQEFISKINSKTGKNYRLPTEAEWEYAAKGGKATRGYIYSGLNEVYAVAWYGGSSGMKTHAVGIKQANELGIYDMTGNVWEWCSDWFGDYRSYSLTNPTGAKSGEYRVIRGGAWNHQAHQCLTTYRYFEYPVYRRHDLGFRLVLPVDVKKVFVEPEMVFVEGGTFQMGCEAGESDEKPVHSVTLSSFNIGKYEVTQAQWIAIMESNPSFNSDCDHCPVEKVSWNDVQQYIQKLNVQTGKNYRLPTEAEWEYAAKGGKASRGCTYSGSNDLFAVAWYWDNCGGETHPVGIKQANELGIYDMTGNVWEWCSDWYGEYSIHVFANPLGPSSGLTRVLRGSGWGGDEDYCRISRRDRAGSVYGTFQFGFRLVLPVEN